jgi:hypothetical protein
MQEYQGEGPQAGGQTWEEIYNQFKDSPDAQDQFKKAVSGTQQGIATVPENERNQRITLYNKLKTMLQDEPDLIKELELFFPKDSM